MAGRVTLDWNEGHPTQVRQILVIPILGQHTCEIAVYRYAISVIFMYAGLIKLEILALLRSYTLLLFYF